MQRRLFLSRFLAALPGGDVAAGAVRAHSATWLS